MVENRSLKSPVSPTGIQPAVADSANELQRLKQQVDLLSAQLDKVCHMRMVVGHITCYPLTYK